MNEPEELTVRIIRNTFINGLPVTIGEIKSLPVKVVMDLLYASAAELFEKAAHETAESPRVMETASFPTAKKQARKK